MNFGKCVTIAALMMITPPANAGEMLEPGKIYCNGYGWSYKGLKCADVAAAAKAAASRTKRLEKQSRQANSPDEAQRLRNLADFQKAEAERLAAKWQRKYGKHD